MRDAIYKIVHGFGFGLTHASQRSGALYSPDVRNKTDKNNKILIQVTGTHIC